MHDSSLFVAGIESVSAPQVLGAAMSASIFSWRRGPPAFLLVLAAMHPELMPRRSPASAVNGQLASNRSL